MNKMRELVLRTPEMFIGHQWDATGLYFLLSEVMRLAVRPESANLCSNLKIIIESETVLSIIDDGRGLPVEVVRIDESVLLPKIEHIFSWMVGTNPLPAYHQYFGFLNYLGFVLNAVSERLLVETHFEGRRYELTCVRGEIVNNLRRTSDTPVKNKGTRLTFTPDSILFPDFKFEFENLPASLQELKREFPPVRMILEDKRSNEETEIQNQT